MSTVEPHVDQPFASPKSDSGSEAINKWTGWLLALSLIANFYMGYYIWRQPVRATNPQFVVSPKAHKVQLQLKQGDEVVQEGTMSVADAERVAKMLKSAATVADAYPD